MLLQVASMLDVVANVSKALGEVHGCLARICLIYEEVFRTQASAVRRP
jgi:hypothetical protein